MTEREEWIWLAGLLEGEGCFSLDRRLGGRRDGIRVILEMCDKDVVELAARYMHSPVRRISRKHPRKDTYRVEARGAKAERVMRAVQQWMGGRRGAKIDELLAMPNLSHQPKAVAA